MREPALPGLNAGKAQRYTAAGQTDGDLTPVAPIDGTRKNRPDVAMSDDGAFTVVWQQNSTVGVSVYNEAAQEVTEFLIGMQTGDNYSTPAIAMDGDGDFVVVWGNYSNLTLYAMIEAQRFTATGSAMEGILPVVTTDSRDPDVAMASEGDFVVVWETYQEDAIMARRFTAGSGGSAFPLQVRADEDQLKNPVIAMDEDGDFVAAWSERVYDSNIYDYNNTIVGQRYTSSDASDGDSFMVNTDEDFEEVDDPAVAMNPDDAFAVSWNTDTYGEDDVYARRFSAGSP